MGIILSTGCSNTIGVDLEEEVGFMYKDMRNYNAGQRSIVHDYRKSKNFSTLIGKYYNRPVIVEASVGASNERIIKNTVQYLENTKEQVDLVLVNLSAKGRFTFDFDGELMDLAITHGVDFYLHQWPEKIIRDKRFTPFYEYFRRLVTTEYSLDQHQEHLYRYLVLYLENKGIPYFISPTIHTGVKLSDFTDKCIDISFDEYNQENGRKRAKGNHWLSDSHKAWADLLVEKVESLYKL